MDADQIETDYPQVRVYVPETQEGQTLYARYYYSQTYKQARSAAAASIADWNYHVPCSPITLAYVVTP